MMAQLYSQVPGAALGTGQLDGYYQYCACLLIKFWRALSSKLPQACSQAPEVSLTFGGKAYAIDISDFSVPVDTIGESCVGCKRACLEWHAAIL